MGHDAKERSSNGPRTEPFAKASGRLSGTPASFSDAFSETVESGSFGTALKGWLQRKYGQSVYGKTACDLEHDSMFSAQTWRNWIEGRCIPKAGPTRVKLAAFLDIEPSEIERAIIWVRHYSSPDA